ncbi:MAG: ABC transporter ATP-binding protein [Candidatus Methylacidiphilales bacterium]
MSGSVLSVEMLRVAYGPIEAVKGISFEVARGEIVTVIGSNGAGKTSTLRALSGMIPCSGSVRFKGQSLAGIPAHARANLGLVHVPEGRGIFNQLTVLENLRLATWCRRSTTDFAKVFRQFPRLEERKDQAAGTLSGGEQQMLALGRALLMQPEVLLLDEPSMGLAPVLVQETFRIIARLREEGMTILLVEQNAHMALSLADRACLLETGTLVASGRAADMKSDPRVRAAYLG